MSLSKPWQSLNMRARPAILAPLAGVSDHPFRRICAGLGADLTYVEMLSATALCYGSRRTFEMMERHASEERLGVQITSKTPEEAARATEIIDKYPFETIDINMGCPVNKVVRSGCGSAILKDPERVFQTVKAVRSSTDKLVSAKIRLGWDHQSINALEISDAIQQAGAHWLTVHGRLRSDDYSAPVNLELIAKIKRCSKIPVVGNGNIFSLADAELMHKVTDVDGVMVSRGALGNPWVFRDINSTSPQPVHIDEWLQTVLQHLTWQQETYGTSANAAVCMRKHLLWYTKGWPGGKNLREQINQMADLKVATELLTAFAEEVRKSGQTVRLSAITGDNQPRFQGQVSSQSAWDPKYEMDRTLDRGCRRRPYSLIKSYNYH